MQENRGASVGSPAEGSPANVADRPQSSPLTSASDSLRRKMMKSRFALDHHVVGKNHPIRNPVELAPLGNIATIADQWGFEAGDQSGDQARHEVEQPLVSTHVFD